MGCRSKEGIQGRVHGIPNVHRDGVHKVGTGSRVCVVDMWGGAWDRGEEHGQECGVCGEHGVEVGRVG